MPIHSTGKVQEEVSYPKDTGPPVSHTNSHPVPEAASLSFNDHPKDRDPERSPKKPSKRLGPKPAPTEPPWYSNYLIPLLFCFLIGIPFLIYLFRPSVTQSEKKGDNRSAPKPSEVFNQFLAPPSTENCDDEPINGSDLEDEPGCFRHKPSRKCAEWRSSMGFPRDVNPEFSAEEKKLGSGTYGDVFKCYLPSESKYVAVKESRNMWKLEPNLIDYNEKERKPEEPFLTPDATLSIPMTVQRITFDIYQTRIAPKKSDAGLVALRPDLSAEPYSVMEVIEGTNLLDYFVSMKRLLKFPQDLRSTTQDPFMQLITTIMSALYDIFKIL